MSCPWDDELLLAAAKDQNEFFRYCAGAAYEIKRRRNISTGLDIRIKEMELPLKKGVSSSAAVCILVAKAFSEVYDLCLFPNELMEMSYLGERLTGSQCGRMDQACIYGSVPVLLVFEKGKDVKIEPIFAKEDIYMFYTDLAGKKNTVRILKDLHVNYLKDEKLQITLGTRNEHIVRRAFQVIQRGKAKELGELMAEAQRIFDDAVAVHSRELAAPLLHDLLVFSDIQPYIYGGKGVGSQGDGTAQFVAKTLEDRDRAMEKITTSFPQMRCFPLTIRGNVLVEADSQSRLRTTMPVQETGTKDGIDNRYRVLT